MAGSPSVEDLEKRLAEKDAQLGDLNHKAYDVMQACKQRPESEQQKCQMDALDAHVKKTEALSNDIDKLKKQVETAKIDRRNSERGAHGGVVKSPHGKYIGFFSSDRAVDVFSNPPVCKAEMVFVKVPKRSPGVEVLPPRCGPLANTDMKKNFCQLNVNAGSFFAANYWRHIYVENGSNVPDVVVPECISFGVGGFSNQKDVEFRLAVLDFFDEVVAGGFGKVSATVDDAPLKEWFKQRALTETEPRVKARLEWLAEQYSTKGSAEAHPAPAVVDGGEE